MPAKPLRVLFLCAVFALMAVACRPPTNSFSGTSGVNWDAVAQCETGGNWSAPGPTYQGGLGLWYGNWSRYGGYEFADNAGHATREQQIIVAERLLADVGWGWGCPRQ